MLSIKNFNKLGDTIMNLNNKLDEIKKTLNITSEELAYKLQLPIEQLLLYEKNEVPLALNLVYALNVIYRVNLNWLLNEDKNMFENSSSNINIKNKNGYVALNGGSITVNKE